ncbi:unnamed protein product, partial [Trichogramma brassicae]
MQTIAWKAAPAIIADINVYVRACMYSVRSSGSAKVGACIYVQLISLFFSVFSVSPSCSDRSLILRRPPRERRIKLGFVLYVEARHRALRPYLPRSRFCIAAAAEADIPLRKKLLYLRKCIITPCHGLSLARHVLFSARGPPYSMYTPAARTSCGGNCTMPAAAAAAAAYALEERATARRRIDQNAKQAARERKSWSTYSAAITHRIFWIDKKPERCTIFPSLQCSMVCALNFKICPPNRTKRIRNLHTNNSLSIIAARNERISSCGAVARPAHNARRCRSFALYARHIARTRMKNSRTRWESCTFGRFPRGSRPGFTRSEHHATLVTNQVGILYFWTISSRKSTGFYPFRAPRHASHKPGGNLVLLDDFLEEVDRVLPVQSNTSC